MLEPISDEDRDPPTGSGGRAVTPRPANAGERELLAIAARYAQPDNLIGFAQCFITLVPLALLWVAIAAADSLAVTVLATAVMSLFLLRSFSLMHECGHSSLFRSGALNRAAGFVFGVVSGMPQYVWAHHHRYHHATNGNWARYRGPLAVLSVDEYAALTPRRRRAYVRERDILMAPLGGLLYMIVNPRLTWLKGSARLAWHVVRGKIAQPERSLRQHAQDFKTPYWTSAAEYRHMSLNNLVLLSGWAAMCWWLGPALFFSVYFVSGGLAGAAGIILFTVQHNFEHSYASDDQDWSRDEAAIRGTSFLVLPGWLNWFTANIGYHHVHHLCARIPSHRLVACHEENAALFAEVRRLTLADVLPSVKYLLWDQRARRLISVAEYDAAASSVTA
ncbi:MAG: fatty acid desaturase [Gammaproteobacteria bacterium]